jgi:hypothetical protein
MITFKEYLFKKLEEDAPANSVGTPSGVSPPAAPNPTCTNIPTKNQKKVLTRKGSK